MSTILMAALMSAATSTAATSTAATSTAATSIVASSTVAAKPEPQATPANLTYGTEVEGTLAGSYATGVLATWRGDLAVSLIYHPFGRVEDDDSPRSFQAFLQRRSTMVAALRGSTAYSTIADSSRSQQIGAVALAADIYLDRRLVITGSAELGGFGESIANGTAGNTAIVTSSASGAHLGASIGFGLHIGEATRVDVGFRYLPDRNSLTLAAFPLNAPGFFVIRDIGGYATLRTIMDRTLMLRAEADLFSQGAHGSFGGEYAFGKDLALAFGLSFSRVSRDAGVSTSNELAAALRATYWVSPDWRVSAEYLPFRTWTEETGNVVYTQILRFGALVRF